MNGAVRKNATRVRSFFAVLISHFRKTESTTYAYVCFATKREMLDCCRLPVKHQVKSNFDNIFKICTRKNALALVSSSF